MINVDIGDSQNLQKRWQQDWAYKPCINPGNTTLSPQHCELFCMRIIVFGDQIFCDNAASGSVGGGTKTRLPEVFTKCPTGTLPQLHRPPWVSLVELVWLVVLLAMVPRISLPESPLSCKDAATQFQANNKKIKPNITKFLISYLLKTTVLWLNK